jgi:inorganic pyrophosphatase
MDEPAFAGCWVTARLIGVIEAEQTERDGQSMRNDRLVAVAAKSHTHRDIRELSDLSETLVEEIEHFFASYNAIWGKQFKPLARHGASRATDLVREGMKRSDEKS